MGCVLRCQLWLLIVASTASAADLTLPLDGYYRTGKYFPVRFSASSQDVRISAEGAITTVIPSPTGGIAPFLPIRSPLEAVSFSAPLRELQPDEKLVGYAVDAPGVAERVFPGKKIIAVRLDPADPLPGPPMAWETLDGLVLTASQWARFSSTYARDNVFANGTAIMVLGSPVIRPPAAPLAIANDGIRDVLDDRFVGRPPGFRRLVFAMGAIFAILLVGVSLWRSVWSIVLSVTLAAGAIAIAVLLRAHRMEEGVAATEIYVVGSPGTVDLWSFHYSMIDHDGFESFDNGTLPVFPIHFGPQNAELDCDSDGTPREFHFHFPAGHAAAFVSREMIPVDAPTSASASISSPLLKMLPAVYPGMVAVEETEGARYGPTSWVRLPRLTLESSDAIPK